MPPVLTSPLYCAVAAATLLVPTDLKYVSYLGLAFIIISGLSRPKLGATFDLQENIALAKSHPVLFTSGLACLLAVIIFIVRMLIAVL